MNLAHIHLLLNHVPVVGIPIALIFLAYGLLKHERGTQRFALMILFALAMFVIPVYLTGEPAEHRVKHMPGVTEEVIEPHEEAAMYALVMTCLTGGGALVALFFQRDESRSRRLNLAVGLFALLALASLVRTASFGGQIRHTEIRTDSEAG